LRENLANFIPGFAMTPGIAIAGIAMILALGLITGIIPALNAMRLRIAAALGRG
jgi:putative ABC transport system permease protein